MNRRIFLLGVTGATAGCLRTGIPRLNVYNWESYVAANTISNFESEFKCRVRYATYSSAEEMLAKVMSGNSGWDVVFPSNSFIGPMRELSLLLPLDHAKLPNLNNLDPLFKSPEWDPQLSVSVPYMHSATGILYSQDANPAPLSWAAMWTNDYQRRVTMLDDPAEVFAACLKRNGYSGRAQSLPRHGRKAEAIVARLSERRSKRSGGRRRCSGCPDVGPGGRASHGRRPETQIQLSC